MFFYLFQFQYRFDSENSCEVEKKEPRTRLRFSILMKYFIKFFRTDIFSDHILLLLEQSLLQIFGSDLNLLPFCQFSMISDELYTDSIRQKTFLFLQLLKFITIEFCESPFL